MKLTLCLLAALACVGCGKLGISGELNQIGGNWAEVRLPEGCKVKAIAAEGMSGVAVLCEDGRVFH